MPDITTSRRGFLKGGGALIVGTLTLSSGSIALMAPTRTWALEVNALDEHQGKTLLKFARHLYPHDDLEDAAYALVVKELDESAEDDPGLRALLQSGVRGLDGAAGGSWLDLDDDEQFLYVAALEGEPFFDKMRSTTVVSLYNNDLAFAHFGYPGEKGHAGYLHRGFNDLHWLPELPDKASGPMPDAESA
ncbi:MAG TPA: hypothetical protein VK110_03780 [Salinisphaeraceae bacterium]|nr:hypothetical protein [Salinisphaeraceae bacterium]